MEKEGKIQVQQIRTKKLGIMALAGTLMGFIGYNGLVGLGYFAEPTGGTTTMGGMSKKKRWVPAHSLPELERIVQMYDTELREIKATKIIMETDPASIQKIAAMEKAVKNLIKAKYGDHEAYRVRVDLEFPPTMPDFAQKGKDGSIVIEMAPLDIQPVSVYNFMEIARTFERGAFHRNAEHVLQVQVVSSEIKKPLPFQEYHKEFPHKLGTTGYAGRPSGPGWYISIEDNTENHGPGSQQKHNPYEADANFGTVVVGMEDVVPRIHSIKQDGWLERTNQVKITKMSVQVPDERRGGFKDWVDWTKM